jgi:hypothetical protein
MNFNQNAAIAALIVIAIFVALIFFFGINVSD